ncbi:MAG: ArsR family transcriptional regulator [Gammaproteobacteria bacterium]|nr:MAG: ArsR family transcriptional regulator [Gammaproteobacteria bacterium]
MNMDSLKINLQEASSLLKAMSNEHRLMILCHLVDGEKTVRQLEELVGLRQTTLSQHLARLRYEGLVSTRREAQNIFYSLSSEQGSHLLEALHGLYCVKPGTSNHEPTNFV